MLKSYWGALRHEYLQGVSYGHQSSNRYAAHDNILSGWSDTSGKPPKKPFLVGFLFLCGHSAISWEYLSYKGCAEVLPFFCTARHVFWSVLCAFPFSFSQADFFALSFLLRLLLSASFSLAKLTMPHCRGHGRRRGGRRRGKRSHQHHQQPPLASVDATLASGVGTSGPTATYFQLIISPASPRPHSPLPLPRAQPTNNEVSHQLNDHHDAPLFQFIHDNRENGQRESTGPLFRRFITSANTSKPAAPSSSSSCSSVPSYAVMASSSSSSHEAKSPIVFSVKVTPADGRCLVEPRSPALFRFVDSTSSYGDSSPDVSPSLAKNSALRCDVSPSFAAPNANENEKSTTTLAAKPHSNGPATSPHSRLQKPLHIQITPPTPQLPHTGILRDSDKGALFQFVSSTRNEGEEGKGTPSDSVNGDVTIRFVGSSWLFASWCYCCTPSGCCIPRSS